MEKIMTLNITIPNNINDTKPRISVIGIGGAGGNAALQRPRLRLTNTDVGVAVE